jgi:AcrR family transcriptional regulator
MKRTYTLKKRAEQQADTRQRIVDATIELHSGVGPARTTFSMVAERAGVQRHTLYAHFPDEHSLFLACSGQHLERQPLPEAEPWRAIAEPRARLRTALPAIYGWYERNDALLACVVRDIEHHAPTQKIFGLRIAPHFAIYREVLGEALSARQRAVLALALSFHTWRTLTRDGGQSTSEAADAMVKAIADAG